MLIAPCVVYAQVDVNVYNEAIYTYLDKLASAGLIRTYSPNQKPLSRYSVAKMVVEAREEIEKSGDKSLEGIIFELETEFNNEIEGEYFYGRALDAAEISWTATDQKESAMPANGMGTTIGMVQPLLSYKDGRHYDGYGNLYIDTSHWFYATPYFAAYLQPQAYSVSGDGTGGGARLYRGYVKTGFKNLELQVGRDDIKWGPGKYSLFFSNNARAQDMIRLTTPSAFRLPWVFSHLGQWRLATFFSWLDNDSNPHNVILSGYRIDYQPLYWLDVGFDHAVFMGGTGMSDPNVKTALGEYMGFIFDSGNSRASSNHLMGIDMTLRLMPLMGAEIYGKLLLEDTQKEYGYMLANDASWLGGVYLPHIEGLEKLSIRGEFVYSGQFAGRHSIYTDGFVLDNKFIGYDAGSDTYSGTVEGSYLFNLDEFASINIRYLQRSSDTYNLLYDASGNNNGIAVAIDGAEEQHVIFKLSGQKRLSKIINVYTELGLDRVQNKSFTTGRDEFDFSTQIKFIFHNL